MYSDLWTTLIVEVSSSRSLEKSSSSGLVAPSDFWLAWLCVLFVRLADMCSVSSIQILKYL
jgi:hypothetical protein